MVNILKAICNIVHQTERTADNMGTSSHNRMNHMGGALETYMKDAFCGTFHVSNEQERNRIYSQNFSWLGNQNNPPDFMIREGDAIEVKKIESINSDLALNSSYPKSKLYSTNPMIAQGCRDCESWDFKDIIYSIGCVKETELRSLWMIYGSIFAAESDTYERIKSTISTGINSIPDVEFGNTKELGRVNRVDPLGITNLRIRGMWSIQNPRKVFEYILPQQDNVTFELVSIIPCCKYNDFDEENRIELEEINKDGFSISNIHVKDPNNPAILIEAKLIKYIIS